MALTVFERFKQKTGQDIQLFFTDYNFFVDNYYNNIVNYYTNNTQLDELSISKLNDLYNEGVQIRKVLNNGIEWASYYDDWTLLDNFELTFTKVETILKSQKWFRSNKGLGYSNKVDKDYVLKQGQTLEALSDELGDTSPQNDWIHTAIKNKLQEEDYSINGGAILKVNFSNESDYKLFSVIDNISGEKVYGKDLQKYIQYEDDDLKILEYRDTMQQSLSILVGLIKGSVPEFPQDGIDKSMLGSNINSIQYPSIFRQQANVFAKDDTFKSFSIISINRDQDNIFIEFSVQTRIGEVLTENLKIA
jgi:hypothetical protein